MSGRPAIKLGVPLHVWVLVELLRERKGMIPKLSVRRASERLAKELARDFKGGRDLPTESIRRHYKRFETIIRRSNSGIERQTADALCVVGRLRREHLGWDASPWTWVIDAGALINSGYEPTSDAFGNIIFNRRD